MAVGSSMDLLGLLRKAGVEPDADFLREGLRVLAQALLEAEVSAHLGAERHERTAGRTGQRNGYRERQWGCLRYVTLLKIPLTRPRSALALGPRG